MFHHLVVVRESEAMAMVKGARVEWAYTDKDGMRHWDHAIVTCHAEGGFTMSICAQVYLEAQGYFVMLQGMGYKSISMTCTMVGFPGMVECTTLS